MKLAGVAAKQNKKFKVNAVSLNIFLLNIR